MSRLRTVATGVVVLPADDRQRRETDEATTRYCFAFGDVYEPDNLALGPLVALNDELVPPGGGYDEHAHHDVEIVTWVVSGVLHHTDSTGADRLVRPGEVTVQSAGAGVRHAERNGSDDEPVRFVQAWLRSDRAEPDAAYAHLVVPPGHGWSRVVRPLGEPGPDDGTSVEVGVRGAAMWCHRGAAVVDLPTGDLVHLHVLAGAADHDLTGPLRAGDTVRADGGSVARLRVAAGSLLLAWTLPRSS